MSDSKKGGDLFDMAKDGTSSESLPSNEMHPQYQHELQFLAMLGRKTRSSRSPTLISVTTRPQAVLAHPTWLVRQITLYFQLPKAANLESARESVPQATIFLSLLPESLVVVEVQKARRKSEEITGAFANREN